MNLRKNKAFTLIELLVVIAIIGILAALIIVSLSGARERARDTQIKNNARNLDTALAQYYLDNNAYVSSDTQAVIGSGVGQVDLCGATNLGEYLSGTAACEHDLEAVYRTISTGAGYAQAWDLNSDTESSATSGNGVYEFDADGVSFTTGAGAVALDTAAIGNFFVTYGPQ